MKKLIAKVLVTLILYGYFTVGAVIATLGIYAPTGMPVSHLPFLAAALASVILFFVSLPFIFTLNKIGRSLLIFSSILFIPVLIGTFIMNVLKDYSGTSIIAWIINSFFPLLPLYIFTRPDVKEQFK